MQRNTANYEIVIYCSRYHYIVLWLGQCSVVGRTCGATCPPSSLTLVPSRTRPDSLRVRRHQWTPPGQDGDDSPHCVGRCHSPVASCLGRAGMDKEALRHPPAGDVHVFS